VATSHRSIILDEVGSTNAVAFAHAQAGDAGPLWIVARRQTQGRGRSGRTWVSPAGNLYASLLVRLACPPIAAPQLSLVAGVATVEAIEAAAGGPVRGLRLKWPNDVLIDGAKCVGILAESQVPAHGEDLVAVIGIGINLAGYPDDLGRAATSLAEHGVRVAPEIMHGALADAMARWLGIWSGGAGFAEVRAAWRERAGPVGEPLSVNTGGGKFEGAFVDIDETGALMLRDAAGQARTLTFGDVTLGAGQTAGIGAR
jgi:BirA family biotin operon repressor/biotin-[acetyl-CoA-carboxylase] ligase